MSAASGFAVFPSGDFARATALYPNAIALLRAVNDRTLLADALIFYGTVHHSAARIKNRKG